MLKEIHGGNIYKYDHKMTDFSANLNPLGMPEAVKKAIIGGADEYESYPDPFCRELKTAISEYHGKDHDLICCGNGAADLIYRIAAAYKPKKALIAAPAFSEYGEALEMTESRIDYCIADENKGFRFGEELIKALSRGYDMAFICNPGNPTGVPIDRKLMQEAAEICRRWGTILIVDECFMEFIDDEEKYSLLDDVEKYDELIILKAFTKIFAMAGIRLGYCICGSRETAERISGCMQAWPVSTPASKAGVAALKTAGHGFVDETRVYVAENRKWLTAELCRLGFKVYDSRANYVFFRSEIPLVEELESRGIMIRSCANYEGLDNRYYRAAVRTEAENRLLVSALEDIAGAVKKERQADEKRRYDG